MFKLVPLVSQWVLIQIPETAVVGWVWGSCDLLTFAI